MATRHVGEETKGRVKEAAGDLTGDRGLKREGKVDRGSARVKDAVSNITEDVREAVNPKRRR